MKILILGANGMLGHALINAFANEDIMVGDLPEFDITKTEDLKLKIKGFKPEIVINAAAFTKVDECEAKKNLCNQINGEAVGDLAKICKDLNAILVHYSTDYVFDGNKKEGYLETDQTKPVNAYGASKELGEKLLQKNTAGFYLIRTAWLYGPFGKNFVDTIIELALKQKEIKVVNDQFGNPTYAKDLAQATKQILIDKPAFGIYHRTNAQSCSWHELAKKIKEIMGLTAELIPVSSAEFPMAAKRPRYSKLINTKLPELRSWTEALEEYLKLKS